MPDFRAGETRAFFLNQSIKRDQHSNLNVNSWFFSFKNKLQPKLHSVKNSSYFYHIKSVNSYYFKQTVSSYQEFIIDSNNFELLKLKPKFILYLVTFFI